MERKIKIQNKELFDLLKEKGAILKDARKVQKAIDQAMKDRMGFGEKIQALKDKIVPIVEAELIDLEEFEIMVEVDIEGKTVKATVVDQLEVFKKVFKEKQEAEKNPPKDK